MFLQLKHCGKQVLDIFIAIAKSLDLVPCQHLNSLMYQLDTSAHNEQVEDKASMSCIIIRCRLFDG